MVWPILSTCQNEKMSGLIRIPVTQQDLHYGLHQFIFFLKRMPGFVGMDDEKLQSIVAFGLGYKSFMDLTKSVQDVIVPSLLPESEFELEHGIVWRMYRSGQVSICDAFAAVARTWKATRMSVIDEYGAFGLRKGLTSTSADYVPKIHDFGLRSHSLHRLALRTDGMLYIRDRAEQATHIAERYWSEESGITLQELSDHIEQSSWLPLEEALKLNQTMPPGLKAVTYYDMLGNIVGHGFYSPESDAYLTSIFPPDGALFLAACIALWYRRPVSAPHVADIPSVVFVDEYDNPWAIRYEYELQPEVALEMMDVEEPGRQALCTRNGEIWCGAEFEFEGSRFTRSKISVSVDDFEGVLGLQLVDSKQVPEDYCPWIQTKIPHALDAETCDLLFRVSHTLDELGEQEKKYLAAPENRKHIETMAARTADVARSRVAVGSELQMQGTLGMVKAIDVPMAGQSIHYHYPFLNVLPEMTIGEYALDYWGKNGIRHDRPWEKTKDMDLGFLAYVILRNLGCDPFDKFSKHFLTWYGLFQIVRTAIEVVDDKSDFAIAIAEIGDRARRLEIKAGKLLKLFDSLDGSMMPSRMDMEKPVEPEWVDYA